MVGVIVCAGKSTRLYPSTKFLSKQMLPLYDKPLIYYPVGMLMKAGIKDIIIVTNEENYDLYKKQFGNGENLGINIEIVADKNVEGTYGSFQVAKELVNGQKVCLVLGDNFFYGKEFDEQLKKAISLESGAYCFGYPVKNPSSFGVAKIDKHNNIISLVEKPKNPESNLAVTGIYVYDEKCFDLGKNIKKSDRGEYEITDLNKMYLDLNELKLVKLKKSNFWLDTGTSEGLFKASEFVYKKVKNRKNQIGCLEEIAYLKGYITKDKLKENYEKLKKSSYGEYLKKYID